jgi:hypothetical protein
MNSAALKTGTGTVSETVSESGQEVRKNSGELETILLETPIKSAIIEATNQWPSCKSDSWLHLQPEGRFDP